MLTRPFESGPASTQGLVPTSPELTVVIPTFNEVHNVDELVRRLTIALQGRRWEAIFVDDDSPDGTAERLRTIARADPRIRCVVRLSRRGLSRAVVEGMLACSAPYIAVMDADLQHDVSCLPTMLKELQEKELDIVVASRFTRDGDTPEWSARRAYISATASVMSRWILTQPLSDPMSGFFVITRAAFEKTVRRLSGEGYKILLDLFASTPSAFRYAEVPYTFGQRTIGESKLDSAVIWEFLMLLIDKKLHGWIPARFVLFCLVGMSGVGVHLLVLAILLNTFGATFVIAQTTATLIAMTTNFLLNNIFTYRDQRLRGKAFWKGWFSFCLLCGLGIAANVGVANAIIERPSAWWIAGLAGAVVGAAWNYAASSVFTWGRQRRNFNRTHVNG